MSSSPSPDPLVSLWQTAPKPDTQHLLQDLQRLKQMHRLLERVVLAILGGVSLLLILAEATGRIVTYGILSVIWILGLAIGVAWQRRARRKRIDALAFDTVSLLRFMLAREQKAICSSLGVSMPAFPAVRWLAQW